jgi:hypothetical protein
MKVQDKKGWFKMAARNLVIAGEYEGEGIVILKNKATLVVGISFFKSKKIELDKKNVESYEVITDEHMKSAASGVARGIVGGALLGPVGLLAGGLSAKNKSAYTLAIQFKDGKQCLAEVDDKIYKNIVQNCF